ncbi:MAG: DUF1640 domain-containing protein [Magnetococcales bacterium]|nr:DUF1640 domain-containing protein [Magnetococcales bacterium]
MSVATFDTLKFTKRLELSVVGREQAEAMADAFKEAQQESDIATKNDLKELELRLTLHFGAMLAATVATIKILDKII